MARTPDPKVTKRRNRALELEQGGMKAREIAEAMTGEEGEAISYGVVRKWLTKVRPPRVANRGKLIELLREGISFEDILRREKDVSREYLRKLEREVRHELPRVYTRKGRRLQAYLDDPKSQRTERYTQYESFWGDLVSHVALLINTNPASAKPVIELAKGQFTLLMETLKAPQKRQAVICNLVQVSAADAARERLKGRPERGMRILRDLAAEYSVGCLGCAADLARREAMMLYEISEYPVALEKLTESENLYRSMGHSGHDPRRNGLANCAVVKVGIFYLMGEFTSAAEIAQGALQGDTGKLDSVLRFRFRFNQALALFEIPGQLATTQRIVDLLLEDLEPSSSLPRLHVVHLAGRVAEKAREHEVAMNHYKDAYEDAEFLEIPAAIGALEADIGRLSGNPTSLRRRIDRLRRLGENSNGFHEWLRPIQRTLIAARSLSKSDLTQALAYLRRESGGDKFLPLSWRAV